MTSKRRAEERRQAREATRPVVVETPPAAARVHPDDCSHPSEAELFVGVVDGDAKRICTDCGTMRGGGTIP